MQPVLGDRQRPGRRIKRHLRPQRPGRRRGDVLEVEGDDVGPVGQAVQTRLIVVVALNQRRHLPGASLRGGIEHLEPQPQRIASQRQHPRQ
ncbi:hypothetical protein RZS08_25615, partial [Arthrospira platensis SPKY1]|nr:hypothetical protein [Arthrospira platensis SPKY1]